jgi:hypothetical protein
MQYGMTAKLAMVLKSNSLELGHPQYPCPTVSAGEDAEQGMGGKGGDPEKHTAANQI